MSIVIAILAGVVAVEYLVIGFFIVPRLARVADGRGGRAIWLAQIGAAAFFLGCAVTHSTIMVQALAGRAGTDPVWHLAPHILQVLGGGALIWAVFTHQLSVHLLPQRGIEAEQLRTRLAAIVQHSSDAILAKDRSGRITAWNAAAARMYGYAARDVIGQSVSLIVPPDRAGEETRILAQILQGETVEQYETERLRCDGTIVRVMLSVSPVYGQGPEPIGASVVARDITLAVRSARRVALLSDATARLAASLDVAGTAQALARIIVPTVGAVCTVDVLDGEGALTRLAVVHQDPAIERAMWDEQRRSGDEPSAVARRVLDRARPYRSGSMDPAALDEIGVSPAYAELIRRGGLRSFAILPLLVRDQAIGVLSVGFDTSDSDDDVEILAELAERAANAIENARLYRDATQSRTRAERAVAEQSRAETRFRVAFQHAPIGVALIAATHSDRGSILQANPALCRLVGLTTQELESRTFGSLVHADDRERATDAFRELSAEAVTEFNLEARFVHANGHPVWIQVHASLVRSQPGEPLYAVAHFQDVTDQKRFEGQLRYLADHDALTGLFNRRRLEDELERVIAHVERYHDPAALLIVDLDNFKYINDTYGHAIGDVVISHASRLLQSHSRETDIVARLGGDEFAIVLPHTEADGAEAHARHLLELLRASPADTSDQNILVTASVGIISIGAGSVLTPTELLVEADVAMYDAKEAGRDRVARVDLTEGRSDRLRARLGWSQRIRHALAHDGFELWQQPIMTLATGSVDRHEILVRMIGDDGEAIPPGVFLYIAEHFGQIQAVDRWVIDHTVQLLADETAKGRATQLEVNLSGASMCDPDLCDFIVERVRTAPINPTHLTFEVTETAAIVNIERAREFARRIADLGCQFALDDFGAGFGSFYYLKHLPFDVVKIDGDFIKDLPNRITDQLTVQAIVKIANGLGKLTVAEFVGDDATIDLLREYGVDFAQGYHVGRPMRLGPESTRPENVRDSGNRG